MRTEISVAQLRKGFDKIMQDYRLTLDCGHKFCFHNLSNTLVVHPSGLMECSECYDSERVSPMNNAIDKPVFEIPALTLNPILKGGAFVPQNNHQIAVLSVYVPQKKKSLTCYVTTQNIQNILKLVEENLLLEKREAEATGKASEAVTSEAVSK